MLYSEIQMLKDLAKEEIYLKNILRNIEKYNLRHNVECKTYSKDKVSNMLKTVQEKRSILTAELNDLLADAPISSEMAKKIKLYYIDDKTTSHISSRGFNIENFHREVKDLLYR